MKPPVRFEAEREALLHLLAGRHSAVSLARALGVSRITAFRLVQRLRSGGTRIISLKRGRDWFFEVEPRDAGWESDPVARLVGFARSRRPRGQSVDDAVYGPRR